MVSYEAITPIGKSVFCGGLAKIPSIFIVAVLSSFNNPPIADCQLPKYFSAIFFVTTAMLGFFKTCASPASHVYRNTEKKFASEKKTVFFSINFLLEKLFTSFGFNAVTWQLLFLNRAPVTTSGNWSS